MFFRVNIFLFENYVACVQVLDVFEMVLIASAQAMLTAMYNPNTRCNKSFPFHAKTSDMTDIGTTATQKPTAAAHSHFNSLTSTL